VGIPTTLIWLGGTVAYGGNGTSVPLPDPEPPPGVVTGTPAFGGDVAGVDGAPLELAELVAAGPEAEIEPGAEAGAAPEDALLGPQAAMANATAAIPTSTVAGLAPLNIPSGCRSPAGFVAVTAFAALVASIVFLVSMPSPPGDESLNHVRPRLA